MSKKPRLTEPQKQLALKIGSGILFVILGYFLAIHPASQRIQMLQYEVRNAEERSRLISEIHHLKEEQSKSVETFSEEKDRHLMLGAVNTLANKSGLQVDSLVPATSLEDNYLKMTLDLSARGNFGSIYQFLKSLEDSRPDILVSDLSITAQRVGAGWGTMSEAISVRIVLETYLKKGT